VGRKKGKNEEEEEAHKGEEDEDGLEGVALLGEEGDSKVDENKVFRQEGEQLEDVFGGVLGLGGQVIKGVVGHEDATEKHSHDTRGVNTLSKEVRGVGKHNEEARLEHGGLVQLGVLEHQGAEAPNEGTDGKRAKEDAHEIAKSEEDAGHSDVLSLENLQCPVEVRTNNNNKKKGKRKKEKKKRKKEGLAWTQELRIKEIHTQKERWRQRHSEYSHQRPARRAWDRHGGSGKWPELSQGQWRR